MTLWLSCHHPSLRAKRLRQTQQHLFPVASGSLEFPMYLENHVLASELNCTGSGHPFFEDSEPVIVRAEQNTSDSVARGFYGNAV